MNSFHAKENIEHWLNLIDFPVDRRKHLMHLIYEFEEEVRTEAFSSGYDEAQEDMRSHLG